MLGDIIAIILALSVFGYVAFSIGRKKGFTKGFFADENDNDIPDWAEKKCKEKACEKDKCEDCK